MPNEILFNSNLKDKEKLLYCFISSLCAKEGYCWATNGYIADQLNIKTEKTSLTKQTISTYINNLKKLGYVNIEYEYKGKQIINRKVLLNSLIPIKEKLNTPIKEKLTDNKENITNNNTTIRKEYFINNPKINSSFIEFIEHRKQLKAPMTDLAITKMVNKISAWLEKYKIEEVTYFIDNSITNGWK